MKVESFNVRKMRARAIIVYDLFHTEGLDILALQETLLEVKHRPPMSQGLWSGDEPCEPRGVVTRRVGIFDKAILHIN